MATPEQRDPPESTAQAWRRLMALAKPRLSVGTALAAVLTLVLGVAVVAQVRSVSAGSLEDLRESDLVALLDDVTTRTDELETEIARLEADKQRLEGASGDAAAQQAARQRLDNYQVLAGTVAAYGPGISMVVTDPQAQLTPPMMVDLIQELRDAGAEAIQIGSVRIVASSWVGGTPGGLVVDGMALDAPYRVLAIGDAHTLAGAMAIPGGFNDSISSIRGEVEVIEADPVRVTALHTPTAPRYAQPVPPAGNQ